VTILSCSPLFFVPQKQTIGLLCVCPFPPASSQHQNVDASEAWTTLRCLPPLQHYKTPFHSLIFFPPHPHSFLPKSGGRLWMSLRLRWLPEGEMSTTMSVSAVRMPPQNEPKSLSCRIMWCALRCCIAYSSRSKSEGTCTWTARRSLSLLRKYKTPSCP
jgi:hypothetical protein